MAYEETLERRATREQARRSRDVGTVPETTAAVRPAGAAPLEFRDNGQFTEQGGDRILGMTLVGRLRT